jgi:long-subunit fatty acid transport protein
MIALALAFAAGFPGLCGGVFITSNQSADYIRSFERNSALDGADIAYYNLAGTVRLRPGLTVNASNQTLFQRATVRTLDNPALGDRTYTSDNPIWVVPNVYAVYRSGPWAAFTSIQTLGATAVRRWPDGLPNLDLAAKRAAGYGGATSQLIGADAYAAVLAAGGTPDQAQAAATAAGLDPGPFPSRSWARGACTFLAWRHGAAVRLGPRVAAGLAGRLVYARQDLRGEAVGACTYNQAGHDRREEDRLPFDVGNRALGYSGEAGLDLFPADGWVVSLTYEMATGLAFRTTVRDGRDGGGRFADGRRAHLDLPQAWRLGLGWQATPRWRIALGLNAYLEHTAAMDLLDDPEAGIVARRDYRNTWEESVALECRLDPRWLLSAGANVNQIGQTRAATLDVSLPGAHADYLSFGAGFRYEPSDRWRFTAGVAWTGFVRKLRWADRLGDQPLQQAFAAAGAAATPRKEYDKRYLIVAFGVEFHLPG